MLPVRVVLQGGYDHYMQKEIHEQPDSILQTMRGRVAFDRKKVGLQVLLLMAVLLAPSFCAAADASCILSCTLTDSSRSTTSTAPQQPRSS